MSSAGPSARTRLNSAERRRTIVEAALEVFAERGYEAAGVGEIVARAGVSAPILYDHFGSKRQLYEHLLTTLEDELVRRIEAAVADARGPEERVRAAFDAFFALVRERPFALRLIGGGHGGDPLVVAAARRCEERSRVALVRALEADRSLFGSDRERERGLEMLAQTVGHGLSGLALWWRHHPEVSRDEVVERAMDLLWRGLGSLTSGNAPASSGSPDPWRLNEAVRRLRARSDAARPLGENLSEGLELTAFLSSFTGVCRR